MKKQITISLLVTASFLFNAKILQAQTWSHGTGELRTGIPNGGLGGASATTGSLLFYNSTNTNTVNIQSGTTSTNYTLTLPIAAPAVNGSVLSSTTAGVLSWNAGVANIYEASLSLTSTQILALNTPIDIVAAPGAGKYIEVISASFVYTFVTTAYTTQTILVLTNNGSAGYQASVSAYCLNSTFPRILHFAIGQIGEGIQITENTSLQVQAITSNPGPGSADGTGKIKVLYRIVTI